jgi:glycosyltransferase 2 family protein
MAPVSGAAERARRAIGIAKRVFTPVALVFLALVLWNGRDALANVAHTASGPGLAIAVAAWLIGHFLAPLFTWSVLRSMGATLTYRTAWLIHCRRLPARYLPGGVWHTVARYADLKAQQLSDRQLFTWVALENALAAGVTLTVGGLVVHALAPGSAWADAGAAAAAIAGISLVALPFVLARMRRPELSALRPWAYLRHLAIVAAFWCAAGGAFLAYFDALAGTPTTLGRAGVFGSYLFAWGIGFVSFFAPQGLGVFEAVAGDLLKADLGWLSAAALVAGFRLVVLGADLLAWGASLVIKPRA